MKTNLAVVILILLFCLKLPTTAQTPSVPIRQQVRAYREAHEKQIVSEFVNLLSIPNHAGDTADIERNAQAISAMLQERGVEVRLLQVPGVSPVVFGELRTPGATRTIGIYAHYDGQPVDPAQWQHPAFSPVLLDGSGKVVDWQSQERFDTQARLYARSTSDDKAPIEATMAALDALRAAHLTPSVNLKFFFEGEEEAGSPHLAEIIAKNPETLAADAWLLCDGPVHQSGRMQVDFGSRGDIDMEMTVYGPARPLHSGHYGNWAPNPIVLLTDLLDSMRDADAHILIPGFYDDVRPLTASERRMLAQTPAADEQLKQELAIAQPEGDGAKLAEQILKPAINVHGIQGGHVGEQAANVISTEARASFDIRLVPNQTPGRVRQEIEQHIERQGFFIVHQTPDLATRRAHARVVKLEWGSGYPAYRAPVDNPMVQAVVRTIEEATGGPIIQVVSLGGSVPMYLFEGKERRPVIGVPIANADNNQHAANENLRLQNLWDGIEIFGTLFVQLGSNRN
ncbi:MAG TPA: M20/M25/M40 family metallo-hydrolase [Terriglobales bacterium]|nr:M20/M25/M40 family metallo-hydrolase [Terriglobales bacterium]